MNTRMALTGRMAVAAAWGICAAAAMGAHCAEPLAGSTVAVDFTRETGRLRRALHSSSWAPRSHVRAFKNDDSNIAAMNLTYARTHDWALVNAGQPVIDYQLIFPLQHLDASDPKNYIFKPSDRLIGLARGIGLDIFYRLGTSIEHTGKDFFYNAAVPADFEHAAEIFAGIVRHYNKGWADGHEWNIKYWGIWCEPDGIDNLWRLPEAEGGNDKEKMPDLFIKFFVTCLRRLKSEFPEIKVGGPDLCSMKVWYLKPLLQACKDANLAPDFISWHYYGQDPDAMVSQAEEARALCDGFGYGRCELILNEWHYLGCGWRELRSTDPKVRDRVFNGPASPNGIDSACFTLSSLIKFQSSKIDQAYFYGCAHDGMWGYLKDSLKNKNWYALCMFGDILKRYQGICASASRQDSVSALAVKSSDGRKAALLVADYRGTGTSITVEVKGVDPGKKPAVSVLSMESDAVPCDVEWDGKRMSLRKPDENSAAFMATFDL